MGESHGNNTRTDSFSEWDVVYMLIVVIATAGRMWTDTFIFVINCRDWIKKKCLSPIDRILTLQSVMRICFGCTGTLWYALAKFYPWVAYINYVYKLFMIILWYLIFCNLWLMASMCGYYCVKIININHPFFIQLKTRLSGLVPAWLLGSMVLSLANILPYFCWDLEIVGNRNISRFVKNKTEPNFNERRIPFQALILLGLGYFTAFSICLASILLLLFSLWRHKQKMRDRSFGSRSPSTYAHFQAMKIILFFLLNNVVTCMGLLLLLSSDFQRNGTTNLVSIMALNCCPSVDSFITVMGNTKLKNELLRALYFAKCRRPFASHKHCNCI